MGEVPGLSRKSGVRFVQSHDGIEIPSVDAVNYRLEESLRCFSGHASHTPGALNDVPLQAGGGAEKFLPLPPLDEPSGRVRMPIVARYDRDATTDARRTA